MKSFVENPDSFEEEKQDSNEEKQKHDVTPLTDLLGFDDTEGEVKFDDIFESSKEQDHDSPENSSNTKSNPGNDFESDPFGDDPFSDPFETKPTTNQTNQQTQQPNNKKMIDLDDLFGSNNTTSQQPLSKPFSPAR